MTLPFENDTSRIVKRLAKQNMKANRRTSISIMVAILIASTFLWFPEYVGGIAERRENNGRSD